MLPLRAATVLRTTRARLRFLPAPRQHLNLGQRSHAILARPRHRCLSSAVASRFSTGTGIVARASLPVKVGLGGLFTGAGYVCWKAFTLGDGTIEIWPVTYGRYLTGNQVASAAAEATEELLVVPEAFKHPYSELNWYWQFLFTARRVLYLAFLFAPCTAVSAAAYLTSSERLREISIRLLVRTFENAGCSFLKFGQWMSMRPDMIPPDVVEALKTLCDASPEHEYRHTRRIVRESFGRDIEDIFESFDHLPVASGSVAQVHRARLKPAYRLADGSVDVAVKVRHPSVERETFVDLDILYAFCDTLAHFSHVFTVPFDRPDFARRVQTQIDFKWEAYNLKRFASNFKKEVTQGTFTFPSLSTELLSHCVLVESWAEGSSMTGLFSKVGDGFVEIVDVAKDLGRDFKEAFRQKKEQLAKEVFDLQMKMILRDNHAHGDLHGGNLMYSSGSNTITVLDAGMATSLEDDVIQGFREFLVSMAEGDAESMTGHLLSFVDQRISPGYRGGECAGRGLRFQASVQSEVDKWIDKDTGKAPDGGPISIGDLMGGIFFKMNLHGLSLRGDVAGQMISFSIAEGLIRQLDPPFDVVNSAKPYLLEYGW